LAEKVSGSSFRVPVINGSITEFIIELENAVSEEQIHLALNSESLHRYYGIIGLTDDKIVSTDVIDNPLAALIDKNSIEVIQNKVKLTAFYDNEAGYSHQLVQLVLGAK
jgi:glyceraldehyde 3-phosphate dehydrogenase